MPYIQRELQPQITRETPPKAVVIFGARQIGKTMCFVDDDRIGLAKGEFDIS